MAVSTVLTQNGFVWRRMARERMEGQQLLLRESVHYPRRIGNKAIEWVHAFLDTRYEYQSAVDAISNVRDQEIRRRERNIGFNRMQVWSELKFHIRKRATWMWWDFTAKAYGQSVLQVYKTSTGARSRRRTWNTGKLAIYVHKIVFFFISAWQFKVNNNAC